jgi:hypothetical protein
LVAAGDPVSSANVTASEDYTIGAPIVRLIAQTAQSLPNNTNTAITYGASSEDIDTHGYHDTAVNPTRVTPLLAGYYEVSVHTHMATASATNYTQITAAIGKNGTRFEPQSFMRPDAASNAGGTAQTRAIVTMNGTTDYLEHFGSQANGAATAQNTSASAGFRSTFEVKFVRPI